MTALSLTACSSTKGLEEEDIATVQQPTEMINGLTSNGLTSNGLTSNGLTSNGLALTSLTSLGLAANSAVMDRMSDAYSEELLTYIISCALPEEKEDLTDLYTPHHMIPNEIDLTINGSLVRFYGQLGLAPQWGTATGTCDSSCLAWVSSCLLSRVNYLGEHVRISLRGDTTPLATTTSEQTAFPLPEATYFGDLSSSVQPRYACTINGSTLISRVCGPSLTNCIVTDLGDCGDFCDGPASDGSYSNCRNNADPNAPGTITYPGSISIFREP